MGKAPAAGSSLAAGFSWAARGEAAAPKQGRGTPRPPATAGTTGTEKSMSSGEGNRGRAPGGSRPPPSGFTLIEILIVVVILGILGAVVMPKFSNASREASENMLKDDLRYLRTQVVVFKAQHRDVPPGYPAGDKSAAPTADDFVLHMTKASDEVFDIGPASATRK